MAKTIAPIVFTAGLLLWASPGPLRAAEPAATGPSERPAGPGPQAVSPVARLRAWCREATAGVRNREIVQMVSAILEGSQMGPGDGWFRAGQGRYGWNWLAGRYDADGDGVIAEDEFKGAADLFERLDRNRDGELKADDFDWSDRSGFVRELGQARQWFARIDKSSNGRITTDEWRQFFEKLAGDKGYVSPDDLRWGLFPAAPKGNALPSRSQEGPSRLVLLKGLLSGELGSPCEGPGVGAKAPDFELETQDGKRTIRLSTFRNDKPVVLIFGSFT